MLSAQAFSSQKSFVMYKIAALLTAGITAVAVMIPSSAAAQTVNPDAKAKLILSPESGSYAVGAIIPIQVLLDTQGLSVSQVDFRLKYDPTLLEVQDGDLERAGTQIKDGDLFEVLLSTSPVDARAGTIQYSKIALSEEKYYKTSGQPGKLVLINFKALKVGTPTVRFETTGTAGIQLTKIYRSSDDAQVLGEVTNGEYIIRAATASASPTATATVQPTSSPTATTTPTPLPSPTQAPSAAPVAKPVISMTIDKTMLKADGKDKAQVKVSLKDKQGLAVANTKLQLSLIGNATITPVSLSTDAQGQAVATLTAGTQAGSISIIARLESDASVSTTSQVTTILASASSPSATATPTPTTRSTATPKPIPAPNTLNQVGPAASLSLAVALALISSLYLGLRRQTSVVKK
ncbi:MAG: Ig-like domain-containing protein [Candidatus Abawacabacteria bacterium]|nr:Ig-like domain-containing protein [Candidatus Abawacabacteria bacterium]